MSSMQAEDFPILCETCLGDNPYLRMTRERHAKACKICDRPMTVYRWRPGPRARFKKTEICATCAKLKNVCQTCILDLQYGLPVQVRDEALASNNPNDIILNKEVLPVSTINRNYMYEQLESQIGLGGNNTSLQLPYNNIDKANNGDLTNNMLSKIQRRSGPYYKRNLPHICSFYVKGTCNRGDSCPYRHVNPSEINKDDTLKDQNIKDRFYGVNDPVANKLLNKFNKWKTGKNEDGTDCENTNINKKELPKPPSDVSIRTLFLGGINWSISEDHIRAKFNSYGSITSVVLLQEKKCGFVTFNDRNIAENVMESLFDSLYINNKRLVLNWARSKNDDNNHNKEDEVEEEKKNNSETDKNNELNGNDVPLSKADKEYLKDQGIEPPELPPMPDPCATISYSGVRNTHYKSMTAHYKEAKVQ